MPKIPDNLLVCPSCKKGWLGWGRERKDGVRCRLCDARFTFKKGVIDLLGKNFAKKSVSQLVMEAESVVNIYESRFWRKSSHFSFFLGIDFNKECALIQKAANLKPEGTILDIACGPGIYTRPLANSMTGGLAVGLDISLPMLNHAARLAREDHVDNTLFLRASALSLPFEDNHFPNVNCCGALHLFPDRKKAVEEIFRVLIPGGCFTVAMVRIPDSLSGSFSRKALRLVGIKGFSGKEMELLLSSAGFVEIKALHARRFWHIFSAKKPNDDL